MTLNEDQQKGYDALMEFVESGGSRMFVLKGYAGTGKTYLISKFIRDVMKKYRFWRIGMTAPTNKAVQVLRESSGFGDNGRVYFKTIHSLLGLREKITDSGEIDFERDSDEDSGMLRTLRVLIIDEVSMLDDKLFFEVRRWNSSVKIIMMGDPAQIPPVNKEDCEPFMNPLEHNIVEHQLTKIMRQGDGSAIVENSFRIREALDTQQFNFNPGRDMEVLNPSTDRDLIKERFASLFRSISDVGSTHVIAWTNRKVDQYNAYCRKLMFGDNAPMFVPGEHLVIDRHFELGQGEVLTTNQEVQIVSMYEEVISLADVMSAKVYQTKVSFTNKSGVDVTGEIPLLHEDSFDDFNLALNAIKSRAITASMKTRREVWREYYNLLRSVAAVKYGYAITAHKAQGSTYGTVIVDATNICLNDKVVERNRILYTAITRAKDKLILLS